MGTRFLRLAVLYVLIGVSMGIAMAATHNFTLRPVHVHVNRLGWVSLALFGLWYRSMPAAGDSKLARAHFWIYNVALPIQMITLAMFYLGNTAVEPVLALASAAIGVAFICFAITLWKHTGD